MGFGVAILERNRPGFFALWVGVLAALVLPGATGSAVAAPKERYAAIVVDHKSGKVLFSRNADAARYPVWNRQRYVKNPDTGKRISRPNPPDEWVVHEVPELRIITDELWDRVKARQGAVKKDTRPDCVAPKPFWKQTRPKYLFSGLMKCGVCGGSYTKISANLFGCATTRNKGTCDNRLTIRRDVLEETVLDGLKHHLMDPDLFKEFADEFYREVNRLRMEESASLDQIRSELATIDRKLRKIVDAITEGVSARSLKDELLTLEARKEKLKLQLASAKDPEPLIHPNLAEVYRQKVADLHEALHGENEKAEAFDLIRSLIEEITFTPENSELRVNLRGELAGILNLCSEKQKPASQMRNGLEQIKMVAGARNRLCRLFTAPNLPPAGGHVGPI